MKTLIPLILFLALVPRGAAAKVRVVSSTSDLASIAQMVGGNEVKVETVCRGSANPHFVEILPSYMLKVARADIYLKVGMTLDYWADRIIDGSGNGDLVVVDCSQNINRLNVPTAKVDPSMGDIHSLGNPHYWLDPANGAIVAGSIAEALERVDPDHAQQYRQGLSAFTAELDRRIAAWKEQAAPLSGLEIVLYHDSWPYFAEAFGVDIIGFVEPKPGIEPTPSHTAALIDLIKARDVRLIGREPYYSDRAPKTIAEQTGAKLVELPTSVDGVKEAGDYFALFDTLIDRLNKERSR